MRYLKVGLAVLAVIAAVTAQAVAAQARPRAATPSAGTVDMFFPLEAGVRAPAIVTGAIGDYGTFVSTDANGKPDPNGDYAKLVLKHGSFMIDGRKLIATIHPVAHSLANCSATLVASGPVSVTDGTGAYAGIHGTLHGSSRGGILLPKLKNGTCPKGNVRPLMLFGGIELRGRVAFSPRAGGSGQRRPGPGVGAAGRSS